MLEFLSKRVVCEFILRQKEDILVGSNNLIKLLLIPKAVKNETYCNNH